MYSSAVDIWSLKVIVFEYFYGLPKPPRSYTLKSWGENIVRKIKNEDWESDQVISLYIKMLRMEPEERGLVSDCLKTFLELRLWDFRIFQTKKTTVTLSKQLIEI